MQLNWRKNKLEQAKWSKQMCHHPGMEEVGTGPERHQQVVLSVRPPPRPWIPTELDRKELSTFTWNSDRPQSQEHNVELETIQSA
ncbi:hypothetical protein JTB14_007368 [Gonioctena quinquepunctata]|nr:hypothetical protein JTB14_007368 [Gonioctena quinquepunctata]